jgi:chromosome partitioning protein
VIVIAVCNTKGGVGKTTLTASLAVRAAKESKRVALVDLDPQASLTAWFERRGAPENPRVLRDVDTASEAVERLELTGWDWVFIDTPPAFLQLLQDAIAAADFVVVPMKPSALDVAASQEAVVMAREEDKPHLVVLNDVEPRWKETQKTRAYLEESDVPVAQTAIAHRSSHVAGMTVGKSAAELNKGKDEKAAEEIEGLWQEIKAGAKKAVKAKAKAGKVAAND